MRQFYYVIENPNGDTLVIKETLEDVVTYIYKGGLIPNCYRVRLFEKKKEN